MKTSVNPTIVLILLVIFLAISCGCSGGGSSGGDGLAENPDIDDAKTTAGSSYSGTLVINEILSRAADGGDDWIELYVTEGSVFLGDYSIVDDNPDHEPQVLPAIALSEGDYYIVTAVDSLEDCPDGSVCVPFKLGSDDGLTLLKNGVPVGILDWSEGQAGEGFSFGLLPDGSGTPRTLSPTKGFANTAADDADADLVTDTVADSFPAVVINEIVAKADDGGEDWIEFFVSGTKAVNLNDYTVIDEDTTTGPVPLPVIVLTPGEYYAVPATEEPPEDGSDYVPLKLGADDSLRLFQGSDLIDRLDWDDGEALIGYSYGRFPDGSENTQTLSPTRGHENGPAPRRQLVINEIMAKDTAGGADWFELYNAGDTVIRLDDYRITDDDKDHEPAALPGVSLSPGTFLVVYATGEETGDELSTVNFKLGTSDSLSLMLNDEVVDYLAWQDSDAPEGYAYGLYPDGSRDPQTLETTPSAANEAVDFFSEETVEEIYIDISQADWNRILYSPLDEEYHPASITYQQVTLENVAFRTKGNSSLKHVASTDSTRFSFKVDMNYYVDGQKLLGMKKINLNNNFKDPSYMRERIAYDMLRALDVPAPRLAYVNLYINGSLHGLYTLVEQVDSEFLERSFENPEGDLYKPEGAGSDLLWRGADFSSYSGLELKTNEESTDNAAVIDMIDGLNNSNDPGHVIDVDEVLRYFAVSTALSNLDSYQGSAHNYYLYEQDGLFSVIPWDLNESFGSFTMGCREKEAMITLYIDEPTTGALADRPLIARLLEHEDYKTAYHRYIEELIYGVMDPANMAWTIDNTKNLISRHVANDPTAFYSYAQFEASLGYGNIGNIFGLQDFVDKRTQNISGQLSGSEPSFGDGTGSCGGGADSNVPRPPPGAGPLPGAGAR